MKIDPTTTHDLFDRMRRAAGTDKTANATAASATAAPVEVDSARQADGLERDVRVTAERVLRGELADPAQARGAVVEQILRHRWDGRVEAAQLDQMVDALTATLVDDPEFRRQIDEMLVLAAREVGTR